MKKIVITQAVFAKMLEASWLIEDNHTLANSERLRDLWGDGSTAIADLIDYLLPIAARTRGEDPTK